MNKSLVSFGIKVIIVIAVGRCFYYFGELRCLTKDRNSFKTIETSDCVHRFSERQ